MSLFDDQLTQLVFVSPSLNGQNSQKATSDVP